MLWLQSASWNLNASRAAKSTLHDMHGWMRFDGPTSVPSLEESETGFTEGEWVYT